MHAPATRLDPPKPHRPVPPSPHLLTSSRLRELRTTSRRIREITSSAREWTIQAPATVTRTDAPAAARAKGAPVTRAHTPKAVWTQPIVLIAVTDRESREETGSGPVANDA